MWKKSKFDIKKLLQTQFCSLSCIKSLLYLPTYLISLFPFLSRSTVVKGLRDSLWEKVEKCKDLSLPFEKVQKFAEEIEIAMFGKCFSANKSDKATNFICTMYIFLWIETLEHRHGPCVAFVTFGMEWIRRTKGELYKYWPFFVLYRNIWRRWSKIQEQIQKPNLQYQGDKNNPDFYDK